MLNMNSAMYFRILSVACRNKTVRKDAANGNYFYRIQKSLAYFKYRYFTLIPNPEITAVNKFETVGHLHSSLPHFLFCIFVITSLKIMYLFRTTLQGQSSTPT
jgi:hypothetical protein